MSHSGTIEGEVVETALIRSQSAIAMPSVSTEEAVAAWKKYEDLKRAVLHKDDFLEIGKKSFPKKSAWRKLATFFNLTIEIVSEKEIKNEDGTTDFDIVYQAKAPNGRSTIGDGSCNTHEKHQVNSRHNTRSTAHTRAYNRAVSNLIGGGEVSAEEIETEDFRVNSDSRSASGPTQVRPNPPRSAISNAPVNGSIKKPSNEAKPLVGEPGDYLVRFGKFSKPHPRKISEIAYDEMESYLSFMFDNAKKNGEEVSSQLYDLDCAWNLYNNKISTFKSAPAGPAVEAGDPGPDLSDIPF